MALLDSVKSAIGSKKDQIVKGASPFTTLALKDIKNLNRPAPTWRWNLITPQLPGVSPERLTIKKSFLSTISSLLSANSQTSHVKLVCESITLPGMIDLGRQEKYVNGQQIIFPDIPSHETAVAVFYESEDYSTLNYFRAWRKYVYNPDSRVYGVPADYAWPVEFIALPITDYEDVHRYMSIKLLSCWPVSVQKLSYGNTTDRIRLEVEFAFQQMEVTIVGGPASKQGTDLGSVVNNVLKWRS